MKNTYLAQRQAQLPIALLIIVTTTVVAMILIIVQPLLLLLLFSGLRGKKSFNIKAGSLSWAQIFPILIEKSTHLGSQPLSPTSQTLNVCWKVNTHRSCT